MIEEEENFEHKAIWKIIKSWFCLLINIRWLQKYLKFTEEIFIPDVLYESNTFHIYERLISYKQGLYLVLKVAALLDLKGHIRINYFKENKSPN